MRIFIFEYLTGGGLLAHPPGASFAASASEGAAMLSALAEDFAALADVQVETLRDVRAEVALPPSVAVREVRAARDFRAAFGAAAALADWTLLIAPETDGCLLDCCCHAEAVGGRLVGPSASLVALSGDKPALAKHLAKAGVATPRGAGFIAGRGWPAGLKYPVVLKPRDGAGSHGTRVLTGPPPPDAWPAPLSKFWLETFCPGLAASVSFLCGPAGAFALPACRQHLSDDGCLRYLGGSLPLAPHLAERATRLAARAIETLSEPRGYWGVDVVLGADPRGAGDVVIEMNPRLTTSYVGLRVAARHNLAAALLDVLLGRAPELAFADGTIEFASDGRIIAGVASQATAGG